MRSDWRPTIPGHVTFCELPTWIPSHFSSVSFLTFITLLCASILHQRLCQSFAEFRLLERFRLSRNDIRENRRTRCCISMRTPTRERDLSYEQAPASARLRRTTDQCAIFDKRPPINPLRDHERRPINTLAHLEHPNDETSPARPAAGRSTEGSPACRCSPAAREGTKGAPKGYADDTAEAVDGRRSAVDSDPAARPALALAAGRRTPRANCRARGSWAIGRSEEAAEVEAGPSEVRRR